jgi:hypothetical protein
MADREDLDRLPAGDRDPTLPPEMQVDQDRHVPAAQGPVEPVQACGVVEVPATADDRLDRARIDVQPPHVRHDAVRADVGVEEDPVGPATFADRDQH